MSEWWLLSLLIAVTFFAGIIFVYPLRQNLKLSILLIPVLFALTGTGYYYWGGFAQWQEFLHRDDSQKLAQQMLKSVKNPQQLIEKLKARLDDSKKSAKGWYLLGRLYTSQNDEQNASEAFAKAYHFEPENEKFAVNYAHSLWQLNHQQFNPAILNIFNSLLKHNPDQPDALAMLAMNAFMSHAYEDAINYWQRLLKMAPDQSEEAFAIRKAIAKAQEQLNSGR